MWPTLIDFGNGAGVHTYGLFILAAFCSAFLLVHFRALKIGLHPDKLIGIYIASAVGGLAGGRLLYALAVEPAKTFSDPGSLFALSGFAFYGGVIGGTIAVGLVGRAQGIHPWKLADIAAPAVVLGLGVGRMGCLFSGCCHGDIAPIGADPIGLLPDAFTGGQFWLSGVFPFLTAEFHGGVGRIHDQPLYPTQLWSAGLKIGLAAALTLLWSRRRFDGQVAALTLMIEPWFRIFTETFRADHRGYAFTMEVSESVAAMLPGMAKAGETLGGDPTIGLTTSQTIGLGAVVFGAVIYVLRRNAGVDAEVPIAAEVDPLDLDPALEDELSA